MGSFDKLLQPGRIGKMEVRNRIVMAPMGSNFAEADGTCGERIQAYYDWSKRPQQDLTILDVDLAYVMRPRDAHRFLFGGGARYARDEIANSDAISGRNERGFMAYSIV